MLSIDKRGKIIICIYLMQYVNHFCSIYIVVIINTKRYLFKKYMVIILLPFQKFKRGNLFIFIASIYSDTYLPNLANIISRLFLKKNISFNAVIVHIYRVLILSASPMKKWPPSLPQATLIMPQALCFKRICIRNMYAPVRLDCPT